ncbi:MAG TPA: pectin acetylesterase-family hydrolase [Kofleriaceae bacterium]|nr:pectin acetylesterase-family hydrolase [Kofleriaceae bacterium]
MTSCRSFVGPSALALAAMLGLSGCSPDADPIVVPDREVYDEWVKVEVPGTVCGDGSQYKFFVNYSDSKNDVVVVLEPGGACWDYESCTGKNGIRGAANVDGLADNHVDLAPFISPFLNRHEESNPHTNDWNLVYVPYCTGDVHTGNAVVTYSDPDGIEPDVVFNHKGHDNMMALIDWMAGQFESVPKLLVTGCSAGGAGAMVNYHWIREGLPGVEQGFLLADSGPIMPSSGWSKPLHEKVYEAWNVPSILTGLPSGFDPEDFGTINTLIADEYPDDRLAVTYFQRDYNFSLYSYERFYEFPPKSEIMSMWADDTELLQGVFDSRDNLAYYLPYWRALNDSHCSTLISFAGSEIQEAGMGLEDFVGDLLNPDRGLRSFKESAQPGEDVE